MHPPPPRSGESAGENGVDYIQLTLFFASAMFFAGITASFSNRLSKLILHAGAGVGVPTASVLLAGYPVAWRVASFRWVAAITEIRSERCARRNIHSGFRAMLQ